VLLALLGDLAVATPNEGHRLFAGHTVLGGWHATANFDACIETAGGVPERVLHFHGALTTEDGGESLGARLSRIERGFSESQRDELDRALENAIAIVVVGYSGLDYFDVDPYWHDLSARGGVRDRTVLWVNHAAEGWNMRRGTACEQSQLQAFAKGGADVYEVCAPTREVLTRLADMWGLQAPDDPPPMSVKSPPSLGLTLEARAHATTRFLVLAGLRDAVRGRLKGTFLTQEEHAWAAESDWACGRYREAAEHWVLAHPGEGASDAAFRAERQAAALWVRGDLRAAYKLLTCVAQLPNWPEVDAEQQLIVAETLGRVLVDMHRLPDTRLLATRRRRAVALRGLDEAEGNVGQLLGTHLRARVASVRAGLGGERYNPALSDPVADFNQSENLLAMLNYKHRQLRERATKGSLHPTVEEYRRQAEDFRSVGAVADAARVPFLPGGERAFSPREVWLGLEGIDFTPWHRARLFLLWCALKVRANIVDAVNRGGN
jgi:hypothetical protein